jgi:branched-chain amino acid transport system substrate-binding protein
MRRISLIATVAAVAIVASGLIGRGAAAEVGVTEDTIKIGSFGALTGQYYIYGKVIMDGAQLVYNEVNAAGGIHGRKIEYIREDDRCDAATGIAAAKKLIHLHKVFMLHAGGCSNASIAARPDIDKAQVPWVVMASIGEPIYDPISKYIYTPQMTASIESLAQVDHAIKLGKKRFGVISLQDAWGRSRHKPLIARLKHHGIEPVADVEMVDTANDATAQVLKLRQANPDVIMLVLYARSAAMYLRDAYKLGFKPYTVGTSAVGDLLKLSEQVGIPEAVGNTVAISHVNFVPGDPEMEKWKGLLQKYYPGDEFLVSHIIGIGSGSVVIEILKRVGRDLTRERYLEELSKLKNFQSPVHAGPITCTDTDHRCNKLPGWVKLDATNTKMVSTKFK